MRVKQHKTADGRMILAVCDSELIGKKFVEGDLQLDLSSDFYKGEDMEEERILELFKVVHIVNLVGEKCVKLGIKAGIVDEDRVIKIKGIPHAEVVIVRD
ncbi:DUF424 family protein [Candidatus Woesearchaeota archaeon]|nr:DUF424 family protein [Candidatus Woesearchaeota archaeon]